MLRAIFDFGRSEHSKRAAQLSAGNNMRAVGYVYIASLLWEASRGAKTFHRASMLARRASRIGMIACAEKAPSIGLNLSVSGIGLASGCCDRGLSSTASAEAAARASSSGSRNRFGFSSSKSSVLVPSRLSGCRARSSSSTGVSEHFQ